MHKILLFRSHLRGETKHTHTHTRVASCLIHRSTIAKTMLLWLSHGFRDLTQIDQEKCLQSNHCFICFVVFFHAQLTKIKPFEDKETNDFSIRCQNIQKS